jgi:peptidoglycan hydrolase CwlO-like protein
MIILNESMALAPHKPQYLNLKSKRRISMNTDHTNLMKRVIVSTTIVPLLLLLSSTASNAQPAITKDTVSVAAFEKESREQSRSRSAFWNLFERVDTVENDVSEIKGAINVLQKDFNYLRQDFNSMRQDFRVTSVIIFTTLALFFIRSEIKDSEMKKDMKADKAEMKADKAEMEKKMEKNKAEADRNFLITTSISTGALLVSIVTSLATKK